MITFPIQIRAVEKRREHHSDSVDDQGRGSECGGGEEGRKNLASRVPLDGRRR